MPKSKNGLIRLHLLVVLLGVIVIIAVVLVPSGIIDTDSRGATDASKAALVASEMHAESGDGLALLYSYIAPFVSRPEVTSLRPDQQADVRNEVFRRDSGPPVPDLPDLTLSLPLSDAIAVQTMVETITEQATTLGDYLAGRKGAVDVRGTALAARGDLDAYLARPTPTNIRFVAARLFQLQAQSKGLVPSLTAESQDHRESLLATTRLSRLIAFVAAAAVGGALLLMTLLLGRRINTALEEAEVKNQAMESATESLEYRNSQLGALYNVFTQITETLSLQYVVNTTTREALKLMNADVVVLRLLKNRQLVPVGSLDSNGLPVEGMEPIPLGEGAIGRTAQRGRALRIDDTNVDSISEKRRENGVRSGIIVPLIVGARVVGVLNCWSRRQNAFGEEDQRIMEMMASQVATAVAAADTHEVTVQDAHHDTLTGLANRRQLEADMAGIFIDRLESGRPTSVAMIDVDHFSLFNNNYGHKMGDITLQKVAHVLKSSIRESDRVYRYGGEEFLVVFDGGLTDGIRLAERLRVAIADTPHTGENLEPIGPITISIGVAAYPEHGDDLQAIAELADAALLQAKQQGRNRVVVWHPSAEAAAAGSLAHTISTEGDVGLSCDCPEENL